MGSKCNFNVSEKKTLTLEGSNVEICGVVMARVLCPKLLFAPFLMYRSSKTKKVSIPICAKCADMENEKNCTHSIR